MIIIRAEN